MKIKSIVVFLYAYITFLAVTQHSLLNKIVGLIA